MSADFWRMPDDEQALARYRAEHSIVWSVSDDEMAMEAGNCELLPEWPPIIRLPNLLSVPMPTGFPEPAVETCKNCQTALSLRDGTWRHDEGYKARGGCTLPEPRGT